MMPAAAALVALGGLGAALFVARDGVEAHPAAVGAKAFSLAEAGLDSGSARLHEATGGRAAGDGLADALAAAAGGNGEIEFDAGSLRVVRDAHDAIVGFDGYGDDVPLVEPAPLGDGWYAAFLTNDPGRGDPSATGGEERALITGVGTAPDGSLELVQAIVEPVAVRASATTCDGPAALAAGEPDGGTATCGPGEPELRRDPGDPATCGIRTDGPENGSSCDGVDDRSLQTRDAVRFRRR